MSLSALNHLKSELQRKKEDAEKKKRPLEAHQLTPMVKLEQEEDDKDKDTKKIPELNAEEREKAKKARDILEAKAKLYDSLSEGIHLTKNSNLYLVNFEQKAVEDFGIRTSSSALNQDQIIDLAKDVKEKNEGEKEKSNGCDFKTSSAAEVSPACSDKELLMKARNSSFSNFPPEKDGKGAFEPTLISPDMQRERMRQKWEEDEKLARSKDDVHYQDILFDEVRSHGVGYFAFSKDEEERRRQQAELEELRKETLKKQEEFRKLRGDAGDETHLNSGHDENAVKEEPAKELTDEEKLKKIEEALRAIKREVHVREWDKGKEIPVMTQEEWIEKKRNERDQDFAPPEIYFENTAPGKKQKRPVQPSLGKTLFQKRATVSTTEHFKTIENEKPTEEAGVISNSTNYLPKIPSDQASDVSNQNAALKEVGVTPIKKVNVPKKSAMALLEQQQKSKSKSGETLSPQKHSTTDELSSNISNIPLPQDNNVVSSIPSSSAIISIPLPPENPAPASNAPSTSSKPFFIPANLVPRKFAPNINQTFEKVSAPIGVKVFLSNNSASTLKESDSKKGLKNPLSDPKLSHYFKEAKTEENADFSGDKAPILRNNKTTVNTCSSHEHVSDTPEAASHEVDSSSSTNEGSRIKLGNLIRNRPAPKSGMALLEEIKRSTRDFGPEADSHSSRGTSRKRGAEIAPPECLLNSTPQLPVRKKGLFSKKDEISDSISAGLQTLKSVEEKKKKKTREKGLLDIL